jgi:DNA-binding GntR family transcriptional regulator
VPALTDDIYEIVKASLMDGVLSPGARISIDGLARELSVSQTPVREALARLEADGLTRSVPNRGYFATELPSREEFVATYELRLQLEPWAAGRAAEAASDAMVKAIIGCLDDLGSLPFEGGWSDYRSLTQHDMQFHQLVHDASGNLLLSPLFKRMHAHLQNFRLYYGRGIGAHAVNEHREVGVAIAGRDPGAAAAAMTRHLVASRDRLLPVYDEVQRSGLGPAGPDARTDGAGDPRMNGSTR